MNKSIRDVLKNKGASIVSVSADETVYKALELMAKEDVGALLVMNEEDVVGIMSERDYARKVILEGRSSLKTSVEKIMTNRARRAAATQGHQPAQRSIRTPVRLNRSPRR